MAVQEQCGSGGLKFSTGKFGNPTLTEEIHRYRIAEKYGPLRSKDGGEDD